MGYDKINVLKWEAIACFGLAIAIALPFLLDYRGIRSDSELQFISYPFIGLSSLFLIISIVLFILYQKRHSGIAKKIDTSINQTRENLQQNFFQKEYTVMGKPKQIAFISIFLSILFIAYIILTIFGHLNPGGPIDGFNIYKIITLILFAIGLILFWNINIIGYVMIGLICLFNIILILINFQFAEIIVWVYPIIGLIQSKKYFFNK